MSVNYTISHTPTECQLQQIEHWLIEEINETGKGFYCNWSIIKSFFKNKTLAIINFMDHPIGFACWRFTSELSGQINIFEIKPDSRHKGIGSIFIAKLFEHLQQKNICVIDLQCQPPESENFWRTLDFQDVPENSRYWDRETKHLFKRLVAYENTAPIIDLNNYIEIWDNEPYLTKGKESTWRWKIDVDPIGNKLKLPIIHTCEKDWRIRWWQDGKPVIDGKIKRFGNLEIDFGPYVIIKQLPKIG